MSAPLKNEAFFKRELEEIFVVTEQSAVTEQSWELTQGCPNVSRTRSLNALALILAEGNFTGNIRRSFQSVWLGAQTADSGEDLGPFFFLITSTVFQQKLMRNGTQGCGWEPKNKLLI